MISANTSAYTGNDPPDQTTCSGLLKTESFRRTVRMITLLSAFMCSFLVNSIIINNPDFQDPSSPSQKVFNESYNDFQPWIQPNYESAVQYRLTTNSSTNNYTELVSTFAGETISNITSLLDPRVYAFDTDIEYPYEWVTPTSYLANYSLLYKPRCSIDFPYKDALTIITDASTPSGKWQDRNPTTVHVGMDFATAATTYPIGGRSSYNIDGDFDNGVGFNELVENPSIAAYWGVHRDYANVGLDTLSQDNLKQYIDTVGDELVAMAEGYINGEPAAQYVFDFVRDQGYRRSEVSYIIYGFMRAAAGLNPAGGGLNLDPSIIDTSAAESQSQVFFCHKSEYDLSVRIFDDYIRMDAYTRGVLTGTSLPSGIYRGPVFEQNYTDYRNLRSKGRQSFERCMVLKSKVAYGARMASVLKESQSPLIPLLVLAQRLSGLSNAKWLEKLTNSDDFAYKAAVVNVPPSYSFDTNPLTYPGTVTTTWRSPCYMYSEAFEDSIPIDTIRKVHSMIIEYDYTDSVVTVMPDDNPYAFASEFTRIFAGLTADVSNSLEYFGLAALPAYGGRDSTAISQTCLIKLQHAFLLDTYRITDVAPAAGYDPPSTVAQTCESALMNEPVNIFVNQIDVQQQALFSADFNVETNIDTANMRELIRAFKERVAGITMPPPSDSLRRAVASFEDAAVDASATAKRVGDAAVTTSSIVLDAAVSKYEAAADTATRVHSKLVSVHAKAVAAYELSVEAYRIMKAIINAIPFTRSPPTFDFEFVPALPEYDLDFSAVPGYPLSPANIPSFDLVRLREVYDLPDMSKYLEAYDFALLPDVQVTAEVDIKTGLTTTLTFSDIPSNTTVAENAARRAAEVLDEGLFKYKTSLSEGFDNFEVVIEEYANSTSLSFFGLNIETVNSVVICLANFTFAWYGLVIGSIGLVTAVNAANKQTGEGGDADADPNAGMSRRVSSPRAELTDNELVSEDEAYGEDINGDGDGGGDYVASRYFEGGPPPLPPNDTIPVYDHGDEYKYDGGDVHNNYGDVYRSGPPPPPPLHPYPDMPGNTVPDYAEGVEMISVGNHAMNTAVEIDAGYEESRLEGEAPSAVTKAQKPKLHDTLLASMWHGAGRVTKVLVRNCALIFGTILLVLVVINIMIPIYDKSNRDLDNKIAMAPTSDTPASLFYESLYGKVTNAQMVSLQSDLNLSEYVAAKTEERSVSYKNCETLLQEFRVTAENLYALGNGLYPGVDGQPEISDGYTHFATLRQIIEGITCPEVPVVDEYEIVYERDDAKVVRLSRESAEITYKKTKSNRQSTVSLIFVILARTTTQALLTRGVYIFLGTLVLTYDDYALLSKHGVVWYSMRTYYLIRSLCLFLAITLLILSQRYDTMDNHKPGYIWSAFESINVGNYRRDLMRLMDVSNAIHEPCCAARLHLLHRCVAMWPWLSGICSDEDGNDVPRREIEVEMDDLLPIILGPREQYMFVIESVKLLDVVADVRALMLDPEWDRSPLVQCTCNTYVARAASDIMGQLVVWGTRGSNCLKEPAEMRVGTDSMRSMSDLMGLPFQDLRDACDYDDRYDIGDDDDHPEQTDTSM